MGAPLPNNCPSEIGTFVNLWAFHPQDNWNDALFEVRIVVAADPILPKRFAAVAWDWVWESDTLGPADVAAVQCFIAARYGHGPENAP
jgi:hypothetical protein